MAPRMKNAGTRRFELTLLFGILLVDLLFALIAGIYLVNSHRHHEELLKVTGDNLVKLLGQAIEDKARLIDDAVVRAERALERQLREGGRDRKRLEQVVELEQEQLPEIDALRITNAEGDVLIGQGIAPGTKVSYGDRHFFQQHKAHQQDGLIITEPIKGKVSGKWVIAFTRAYQSADATFAGVVSAAVPVETFEKLLRSVNLGEMDTVVLRYADMGLVARVPKIEGDAGQPGHNKVSREFADIIASGLSEVRFHTARTPDAVARTYSFRRLAGLPFTIAVGLVDEEYMAPWRNQAIWVGGLLGMFFLGTSASAWLTILYLRERMAAEAKVRDNEEKYGVLFNNEIYAICIFDLETYRLLDVNSAYTRLYGYSREELLAGMTINDITAEPAVSDAATRRAISEGTIFIPLRYHRKKDGTVFPVEIVGGPYSWQGRKVMFGLAHDISSREQAKDALIASEKRFRKLFEDNAAMMLLIDPDTGGIVEANQSAADFYGWSVDQLRSMRIQEINTLPPDAVMGEMEKAKASGSLRLEFQHRKADGSIHDVEVFSSSVEVAGKNLLYSIIHDFSERKKFHDALMHERWRLESIITGTGVGTWEWNVQTGETQFNDRWAEIIGYTLEELAPVSILTWERLVHPEDMKISAELLAQHFTGDLPYYQCECRMKHKSGQWIWIADRGRVLTRAGDGKPLMMFGTHTDITERKQAEEEKIKLEALNWQLQKSDSLMRMAGAIAHHFNNQLGAVMGNLEMAVDDLAAGLQPGKSLQWAMQGAKRAAEVSTQMLTYLGQTAGIHLPLDLSETCRRFLPLLKAAIPAEVNLRTKLPPCGPTVRADANQLLQVLTNLVTNAWESADRGQEAIILAVGTVSPADIPRTYCWPVEWQPRDKTYAFLEVRDNGCGIAEEDFDKLFDPFFSNKFTGRGLGLVKAHSGAITVASQVGHGSTFRVFLPISAEAIPQPTGKTGNAAIREDKGTLLLIEDEEMMREMAATMLSRMGYTVLAARDGVEGVKIFKEHQDEIRVVLSDLTMPGMNGWETRAALRRIDPDIPVIIASGHDQARILAGNPADPSEIFLPKPYQKAALEEALAKAMALRIS
jgi:PAS domain S-box-containing protein